MLISRKAKTVGIALLGLAVSMLPAQAFDASEIIKGDTGSSKIFEFFHSFRKDGKQEEAVEVLKYAAEQGNSAAQWKLGRMYQTGDGVQQNALQAFEIFQKIASQYPYAVPNTPAWQFCADALMALGNYYRSGIPGTYVTPDNRRAQMMYTTAAMVFRHPGAQFELGRMQIESDNGFGQGRMGVRNLSLAYEKGHVGAEALLGYTFFEGVHTRRDAVRGLVMLGNASRRASERDVEWIRQLHEEAYALAKPEERAEASRLLQETSSSLE